MIALDSQARLRLGQREDLEAVVDIKLSLPMPAADHTHRGGFLLGCDEHQYAEMLSAGRVWLLDGQLRTVGFALTLPDEVLRSSPLWQRREEIEWTPSFEPNRWLIKRIGFFDQLAVMPTVRSRYWGAALALRALLDLVHTHKSDLVLATTVVKPIFNAAALPFLARVGAQRVGTVLEHNAAAGTIVSAVHGIEAEGLRLALAAQGPRTTPATQRILEALEV